MSIVLIVLKIGIVISYVSIVKMIVDFKKTEPEARLQLDLLSVLELYEYPQLRLSWMDCLLLYHAIPQRRDSSDLSRAMADRWHIAAAHGSDLFLRQADRGELHVYE